jgi:predicted nuclease of predicted toxin-antitoxin system
VVKHVRSDFDLPRQAEDSEIYNLAVRNNMFVVTMNFKHFKKLVRKNSPGVFVLDSGLSNEQIDTTLSKFISGKNLKDYYGKTIKVK